MNKLIDFLKNELKINVQNVNFYNEALTHKSYANENNLKYNYERLEFLGDSIIYKFATEFIYKEHPDLDEGEMSIIRANFVRGEFLTQVSKKLSLHNYVKTGNSKDNKNNAKIIEDIFEALVGAIYLDLGSEGVGEFLNAFYFTEFKYHKSLSNLKNPKTILQEYLQSESRQDIKYVVAEQNQTFLATVYHDNLEFGKGKGKSRKEAEVNAAKNALERLGQI